MYFSVFFIAVRGGFPTESRISLASVVSSQDNLTSLSLKNGESSEILAFALSVSAYSLNISSILSNSSVFLLFILITSIKNPQCTVLQQIPADIVILIN